MSPKEAYLPTKRRINVYHASAYMERLVRTQHTLIQKQNEKLKDAKPAAKLLRARAHSAEQKIRKLARAYELLIQAIESNSTLGPAISQAIQHAKEILASCL